MKARIAYLLTDVQKGDPLPKEQFRAIVESFDFRLPPTYVEVMNGFNGGEGGVGPDSWLNLFPVEELQQINKDYHILMDDIPEYFLFGKDAADTGYAFHKTRGTFHAFGLMSIFDTDPIELLGDDFIQFLEFLYNYRYTE